MPITPSKYNRGNDTVYTVRHAKSFIRPKTVVETPLNPLPHWDCIRCNQEFSGLVGAVKGRILKGFRVKLGKKVVLVDSPDPTKERQSPEYRRGMVCGECAKQLTITNKAPLAGEIQFLKDNVEVRPHTMVTPKLITQMDEDLERAKKQEAEDQAGYRQVGRIKIPVIGYAKADETPEPIDTNAFRRFMRSRNGGGKKDYEQRLINKIDPKNEDDLYDNAVDYNEIKKGIRSQSWLVTTIAWLKPSR